MKKILILAILHIACVTISNAQSELGKIYPGFVITLSGDTTRGYIKLTNKVRNQEKALFFNSPDDKKPASEFKPEDIKAYLVADRYYESIPFGDIRPNKLNFVLKTISGGIAIFEFYINDQEAIQGNTITIGVDESKLTIQHVALKAGGKPINLDTPKFITGFKTAMGELVKDNTDLFNKITNKEKGYGMVNRDAIIAEYNTWFAAQQK